MAQHDTPHKPEKTYDIVIDAQPFTVTHDELTFEEVVYLAYGEAADDPNKVFTVSYRKSAEHPHDGSLTAGETVTIKNGTVFSVTPTTRS